VSGKRRYPTDAVDLVLMIRMWQNAGFSVREIGQLLAERQDRGAWQDLVRVKIAELSERQVEVQRAREQLEHSLFCRAPDWTACEWMRAAARASTNVG